jgi:ferric-dicitrate binding protein FerR (iron transport regulator)
MADALPPDWQTLDRYLAGEASPDETAAVRRWVAGDAARAELLRQLAAPSPDIQAGWSVDRAWTALAGRLELDRTIRPMPGAGARSRVAVPRISTTVWRIAAAILVVVGSVAIWRIADRSPSSAALVAMAERSAPNGQRLSIELPDRSHVILNAGSRLRYPTERRNGNRDVYLEGEAYFEVTYDAARPFRVHARDAVAEDLGTRFTVSAYAELARVDVVVDEGSVALGREHAPADQRAVLRPGHHGRLGASGLPVVDSVRIDQYVAWRSGALVFDAAPLSDVIPQLERWYDVDVVIADSSLVSRRLSARFQNESLDDVLAAIEVALGASSRRSGRTITLFPVPK